MKGSITRRNFGKLAGAALGAGLLAGCSSNTQSQQSASDDADDQEEVKLTCFSQLANYSGDQTGWGATFLKDRFNIDLTIVPDTDGAYQTRMENGDLGDLVVWKSNGSDYQNAVDKGKLFDWDEDSTLDDYGKDITSVLPEAVEANKELNSDGKIHGIGNNVTNEAGEHDLFIYEWSLRWDLYQKLGHPAITDLDSLEAVLKQLQAACPTGDDGKKTYACSLWPDWDGNMVMYVAAMVSAYWGYDQFGIGHYDSQTGKFYDCLADNSPYLTSLKFFNKLYRDGLLDPDSMTQTYDEMIAKARQGDVLFSLFNYCGTIAFNTDAHLKAGAFMAPCVPSKANVIVQGLSTSGEGRIWSIGNLTENPERVMELIDWLYTPEGCLTNLYGPKGLMWDYDENKKTYFTDLGKKCYESSATDLTGTSWTSPYTGQTYELSGTFSDGSFQFNNTTWAGGAKNPDSDGDCFNEGTWESNIVDPRNDAESDWRSTTGYDSNWNYMNAQNHTVVPVVNFAESTRSSELELKWQQVIKAIKEDSWKAMYASDDDAFASEVSEMQSTCAGYGYDECVSWCNDECARRYSLQQEA
jgi:putative aldouronate transport system substrate-binding protein